MGQEHWTRNLTWSIIKMHHLGPASSLDLSFFIQNVGWADRATKAGLRTFTNQPLNGPKAFPQGPPHARMII